MEVKAAGGSEGDYMTKKKNLFLFSLFLLGLIPSLASAQGIKITTDNATSFSSLVIDTEDPFYVSDGITPINSTSFSLNAEISVNTANATLKDAHLHFINNGTSFLRLDKLYLNGSLIASGEDITYAEYNHSIQSSELYNGWKKTVYAEFSYSGKPNLFMKWGNLSTTVKIQSSGGNFIIDTGGLTMTIAQLSGSMTSLKFKMNYSEDLVQGVDYNFGPLGVISTGMQIGYGVSDVTTICVEGCDGTAKRTVMQSVSGDKNAIRYIIFYADSPYFDYNVTNLNAAWRLDGNFRGQGINAEFYSGGTETDITNWNYVTIYSGAITLPFMAMAFDNRPYYLYQTVNQKRNSRATKDTDSFSGFYNPMFRFWFCFDGSNTCPAGSILSGRIGLSNWTDGNRAPAGVQLTNIDKHTASVNTTSSITYNTGSAGPIDRYSVQSGQTGECVPAGGDYTCDMTVVNTTAIEPLANDSEKLFNQKYGNFTLGTQTKFYLYNSTSSALTSSDFWVCLKNESGYWNAYSDTGCANLLGKIGTDYNGTGISVYNSSSNFGVVVNYNLQPTLRIFISTAILAPAISVTDITISPDDDPVTGGVQINPVSCSNKLAEVDANITGSPSSVYAKLWDSLHSEGSPNYQFNLSLVSGVYYRGYRNLTYTDKNDTWSVKVYADSSSNTSSFTYTSLLAISLENIPIDFNTGSPSQTKNALEGFGYPMRIYNCGNSEIGGVKKVNVYNSGTNLIGQTNPSYSLAVGSVRWALDDPNNPYTNLTTSPVSISELAAEGNMLVYYRIIIPNTISQNYEGNLSVTA